MFDLISSNITFENSLKDLMDSIQNSVIIQKKCKLLILA